jgi:hypothetical protein
MKSILALVLLTATLAAHAQDCTNNVDAAGNVCTTFTLAAPTSNCIPVLTQDGQPVPQFSGSICPVGFFGGAGMQITLPNDPVNPGNAFASYSCTTALVSNTVPMTAPTPQPPGSLIQSLSCAVNYPWYTATWTGTLTYNYVSVHQTHCSGGRGGGCRTQWYSVWSSGSGEISTPPPPPPPPPPPQPTVISTSVAPSACDMSWNCNLAVTDPTTITGAVFGIYAGTLQVSYSDGTTEAYTLDFVNIVPLDDDGTPDSVTGSVSVYDANGNLVKSVDVQVNVSVDEDTGQPSATGGTLTVTIQPPQ